MDAADYIRVKQKKIVTWVIVIVALAIILRLSLYSIDQTEEGVVVRFGAYLTTTDPGLHAKIPFIDHVHKVRTGLIQTLSFGTGSPKIQTAYTVSDKNNPVGEMLTGDLNIAEVQWIMQYKIQDPAAWLWNVYDPLKALSDISRSVVNQLIGDRPIMAVINQDREAIDRISTDKIQKIADSYNMGVQITGVKLQNIVPPAGDVQKAFEDVIKAVQDKERLINEGEEAYNAEIPKAEGQAQQQIEIAKGYAIARVNNAKGDTARFNAVLKEYRRSPQVTRERLYIEGVEGFLKKNNPQIIGKNVSNFLPIQNVTQGGVKK